MRDTEIFIEVMRFGALLAHQLKHPLTALNLNIDELATKLKDTELAQMSDEALEQIHKMDEMIQQIFYLWKLAIKHDVTTIDLSQLTTESINKWLPAFEKQNRKIELRSKDQLFVIGCSELESQVIEVLIENSLNYGAGNTELSLVRSNQWAALSIKDQGFGINESIRSNLMSFGATTSGNGFGLAWAKDQVIQDGGRLEVTSFEPAIFTLYLKLDPINHGFNLD